MISTDTASSCDSHVNQFAAVTAMSGLFDVIVLPVLTGMSHKMVMLLSSLCITVSGSCWYYLPLENSARKIRALIG